MVRLKNLTAGYRKSPVVQEITLEFAPGKVTVLSGPNGSGKSTLLKAASGRLPIMSGEVLYDDVDIRHLRRRQIARKAAFLTQSRNTPSIQALPMVLHGRFPWLTYPRRYDRKDYAMARHAMEATDTLRYRTANVSHLSGGERQGVYLAMALVQDTPTLFMDEPAAWLDINHQLRMMQTAHALAESGKAVVLVLHDIPLALREADRIAVLKEGRLLSFDTPDAVYRSGILEQVFDVGLHRADTPHGPQYYCTPKER